MTEPGIVVVDPSRLFREGLRGLLQGLGASVIAEHSDLTEVLARNGTLPPPELVICTLQSATLGPSLDRLCKVREQFAGARFVLLVDNLSPAGLRRAFQAGVDAILSKDISGEVLHHSLELVLLGQGFFPASLTNLLLDTAVATDGRHWPLTETVTRDAPTSTIPLIAERAIVLTDREKQILQLLMSGASNKLIARELHITEATVKVHVKGLLRKLQAANRTQAAIWAKNNGIVAVPGRPFVPALPDDDFR